MTTHIDTDNRDLGDVIKSQEARIAALVAEVKRLQAMIEGHMRATALLDGQDDALTEEQIRVARSRGFLLRLRM